MAGSRRRTGRPRTREAKAANRRAGRVRHLAAVAAASTPGARVAAASGYLRSALAGVEHDRAERVAAAITRDLIRTADELLDNRKEGHR